MERAVFVWLVITLFAAALLLGTWHAAEWISRRIAARYAARRRLWGGGPDGEE